MGLNAEFVGRTYPVSQPYLVGREKIREFATAIGDDNPVSRDVAAAAALGYPDVVAPPTFAFVLTHIAMGQAMFDPDLGLDYSRVVHGEQRFSYDRPIVAGDELRVQAVIEGIRAVAGNDMLTLRAEVVDARGDRVVTAHSVIVARGTAQEG
jgi:acyl dehydratase